MKVGDAATRRHLEDVRVEIASALDPQRLMPGDAPRAGAAGRGLAEWELELPPVANEWSCACSTI